MRYFEYISPRKVEMLFEQIRSSVENPQYAIEINLGVAKLSIGKKRETFDSLESKVEAIERWLRKTSLVDDFPGFGKFFFFSKRLSFFQPEIAPGLVLIKPKMIFGSSFIAFCSLSNFTDASSYKPSGGEAYSYSPYVYNTLSRSIESEENSFVSAPNIKSIPQSENIRTFVGNDEAETWRSIYYSFNGSEAASRELFGLFRKVGGPYAWKPEFSNSVHLPVNELFLATPIWIAEGLSPKRRD